MTCRTYLAASAALLCLMTTSCTDDSFSQTVEIPLPEHVSRPAMTLDLRTGDTLVRPVLDRSYGLLDEEPNDTRNGVLELFRDDVLIGRMENSEESPRMRFSEPIDDQPGTYRLVGTLPGFDPVEAVQEMPAKPAYTLDRYEADGGIDSEGFRVDLLDLTLNDDPATDDYYAVRVLIPSVRCEQSQDTFICRPDLENAFPAYVESPDPLLQDAEQFGLVISDQSFNGRDYPVALRVDNYSDGPILLEVINFTEDGFRYAVSRAAYQLARDNPFAEPVNVHENVAGGYGYFILGNAVREVVEE